MCAPGRKDPATSRIWDGSGEVWSQDKLPRPDPAPNRGCAQPPLA